MTHQIRNDCRWDATFFELCSECRTKIIIRVADDPKIDKFGKLGYVKEVDKDHFEVTVSVAVSPQFFGWVFGLGNYVTIVGPEDVKEKMKKMLDSVRKRYE